VFRPNRPQDGKIDADSRRPLRHWRRSLAQILLSCGGVLLMEVIGVYRWKSICVYKYICMYTFICI